MVWNIGIYLLLGFAQLTIIGIGFLVYVTIKSKKLNLNDDKATDGILDSVMYPGWSACKDNEIKNDLGKVMTKLAVSIIVWPLSVIFALFLLFPGAIEYFAKYDSSNRGS